MRYQWKGEMFPLIVAVFLCLLLIIVGVMEYMRLHTIAATVKESYQSVVYDLTLDNNENIYANLRDGYSGAYTYDELAGQWYEYYETNYDMIAGDLSMELGLMPTGGGFAKYGSEGELLYRIDNIESEVVNTSFAPTEEDVTFTVIHRFTLTAPLAGLWRPLGPLRFTIEVEAKALALF